MSEPRAEPVTTDTAEPGQNDPAFTKVSVLTREKEGAAGHSARTKASANPNETGGKGKADKAGDDEEWGMPPPPPELVAAARLAPDHWFSVPDSAWEGEGVPPGWAVLGRWRSNDKGEIVEWEDNEDYRPSPGALGWSEPADAVDTAVQRAATGYGPEHDVALALADAAEVAVIQGPDGPAVIEAPDGTRVVPIFTVSSQLAGVELPPHKTMSVAELLFQVPDEVELFYLSPSAPVSIIVEVHTVMALLEGRA
ncbi:type VII secretion system-associated protein [Streptomyces sp. NPDC002870]|uniref:type VII secretion system-associated protein n=1 Tax=Streptomyces sp. NPDC002870 TaxID=3364666 RepID=UPI0036A97B99